MSEVIGFLWKALMVLLTLGAVIYAGERAMSGNKDGNDLSNITQLSLNIKNLYSGSANYSTLTNAAALSAGKVVPDSMKSGGSIVNAFAGTVTVGPNANPSMYDINSAGIPQDSCIHELTSVGGVISVKANGTTLTPPVDGAAAAAACNLATGNTLIFTYN